MYLSFCMFHCLDVPLMQYSYFNGVAQLRQHIKKSQRVHGVILDGGKAANIIPF
jgi:metal-dependent amidase/aminoacylase/carboxypeptidase family protein